jgi:GntR family transcriptional regulator/MocR family aminotransferase
MKQRAGAPVSLFAELDRDDGSPLYRRAYRRIREMILRGALLPGSRLPSTRSLAGDIAVSRNTVEAAFAHLEADGFITRRVGSGTFVAASLPGLLAGGERGPGRKTSKRPKATLLTRPSGNDALSSRGRIMAVAGPSADADSDATFGVCRPSLDTFPLPLWNRLAARRGRRLGDTLLDECDAAGLGDLRSAIAEYLNAARGVRCSAGQVIVVTSTQQALDLIARVLIDAHDEIMVEEPCYAGATAAFRNAGARLVPVRVDEHGLDVEHGARISPTARLCYVTPSHQFPLGVTMTLARRLALLAWAERARAWIVEDDYDSEFRYTGHPLAALQGLDEHARVLYVGTFNKVMFPALRLAYLIVPLDLVDPFSNAREWLDGFTAAGMQAVMADFMRRGHFVQHIRRMRAIYHERRDALCAAVERHAGDRVRLGPADGGMHVVGWLPRRTDVTQLRRRVAQRDMYLRDVAVYYASRPPQPGVLLNFASATPAAIDRGVAAVSRLIG